MIARLLRSLVYLLVLDLSVAPVCARHRSVSTPGGTTCNNARNRGCWTDSIDINTDYEDLTPVTGRERTYTFVLTEIDNFIGGDGAVKKKAMLVNGQFPGPIINADWGDRITITVVNRLQTNGTSVHWHGIRQLYSCTQDGTNGVTGCPIPPGGQKRYSFLATQYGTAWYHSHFSAQYGNGVLGAIVINGPASLNYDIDLGPLLIGDWYHMGVDAIVSRVNDPRNPYRENVPGSSPPSDNVLFNGLNVNTRGPGGDYHTVVLTKGAKHRLRLINHSVENTFTVSISGHSFWIIATDMVPVKPVRVDSVYMSIGQRYDIVIEADQEVATYWINATFSSAPCGSSRNSHPAAVVSYKGAAHKLPKDYGATPPDSLCADHLGFQPVVQKIPPLDKFQGSPEETLDVKLRVEDSIARVFWPINNTPMNISWGQPTLRYVQSDKVFEMNAGENVIHVPGEETWAFWLIQNDSPIPHPMHLHGHDILVLGSSDPLAKPREHSFRAYNPGSDKGRLNGFNPTRRDTTVLPAYGWSVVAFHTNNPGAWVFHCHVAWHVSQGMSIQFLEQESKIPEVMKLDDIDENCNAWNDWYPMKAPFQQDELGL